MGQKVNPIGFRLGINKTWESRWFNLKEMPKLIKQDMEIREFVRKRAENASIARIDIERMGDNVRVTIHTDKPGVIIGKGGADVEGLKNEIDDITGKNTIINIEHIKRPQIDANIIAESIGKALIKKIKFRGVIRKSIDRAMQEGVKGIKIAVSGRLNGAEIARTEWAKEGKVPLQTIRANIDYGFYEANTTYGNIGIKVWICHGEIIDRPEIEERMDYSNETEEG
ncbi:MAG: 30S ribosomal protein S3 [Elusimicrobia bacterium]|nr:30S ribosomal protein S3 [Elusimicrobiota bacterium]